jgi:SAM-dependent methyltransferase
MMLNVAKFFHLSAGSARECPICGWRGQSFARRSYPYKPADCLVCPSCGSFERHRFAYIALKDRLTDYAERTLHIAPEKCIERWLRSISRDYLSVDLSSPSAMEHMDVTELKLPDEAFSLVWCSHVLEHIENDRKAMAELLRVLRPSGVSVILVPIYGSKTYEDPEIQSPEDRLKHFKQEDHVRLYGSDIEWRLADIGFKVNVIRVSDMPAKIVARHALEYPSTKEIFLCSKS